MFEARGSDNVNLLEGGTLMMTKYNRPPRFGFYPQPNAADPWRPIRLAVLADDLGLDYVGIQDDPTRSDYLDTWTLLSAIAMHTSRVGLFTDVAALPVRLPAMLAREAATLDLLSGGRVELGLGAGALPDALAAIGAPHRTGSASIKALEEAMRVIRLMWSDSKSARFEGEHYRLVDAAPCPTPAHPIGLWLGVNKPQGLALVGRLADGWIPTMFPITQPKDLIQMSAQIDAAAHAAGRDPATIQRILNIRGTILNDDTNSVFNGSVKNWCDTLVSLTLEAGIDTFMLMDSDHAETQMRRFALEIVPHVYELLDEANAGCPPYCDDTVDEASRQSFPASDPPSSKRTTEEITAV
jgi:hypothetical protein